MAHKIAVTQLTRACVDPDWRERWIKAQGSGASVRIAHGGEAAMGLVFHSIADQFARWLTTNATATELRSGDDLWGRLYDWRAGRRLEQLLSGGHVDESHLLAECMKSFCARLADVRARVPGAEGWDSVLLTTEQSLRHVPFESKRGAILVSGRIDAVRRHPEHHLEAVDYKVSQGANQRHDMVQVAIYAAMLERSRPGLSFCGTAEYYLPGLKTVEMSPDDLRGIFDDVVQPVIDEYAKTHEKKRPGDRVVAPPRQQPRHVAKGVTARNKDQVAVKIEALFRAFKLEVDVLGSQSAPQVVRYKVRPAPGVAVAALARKAADLQVALGVSKPPLIAAAPGFVSVDVPRDSPLRVFWRDVVKMPAYRNHPSSVCFAVGVGVDGALLVADFSDANMAHALVAGSPGSGKSEFLRNMVACLIERTPAEMLRIALVDPKLLTFTALRGSRHLDGAVITDVGGAIACLTSAVSEMERRYQILAAEGCLKLSDRIAHGKTDIPYRVIVFDEFSDLILAGRENKKEFEQLVARLAQKGRASGIHLVLATQRPDNTVVTGLIKASLPLKICLRVINAANSQIVLGQSGGEALLGNGDLLCDMGKSPTRAQSPLVRDEELQELAKG